MLAAKKLDEATYTPSTPSPEQPWEEMTRPRTKPKLKPRFFKFLYVATVFSLFCGGLYFCSLAMGVATKGYEITKLKNEINALETANERLRLEIAELDSLERIEMLALNELGMIPPGADDYVLLPGADDPEQPEDELELQVAGTEEGEHLSTASEDDIPLFRQKAAALWSVALQKE